MFVWILGYGSNGQIIDMNYIHLCNKIGIYPNNINTPCSTNRRTKLCWIFMILNKICVNECIPVLRSKCQWDKSHCHCHYPGFKTAYRQTSDISCTLVGDAPSTFSIGQRQLQDKTRHIKVFGCGGTHVRDLTVICYRTINAAHVGLLLHSTNGFHFIVSFIFLGNITIKSLI